MHTCLDGHAVLERNGVGGLKHTRQAAPRAVSRTVISHVPPVPDVLEDAVHPGHRRKLRVVHLDGVALAPAKSANSLAEHKFLTMRGPEMKSNSSGAMGTCVAGANVAPDDPFRCAGPWCADLAVSLGADNDPEFSAWSGLPASEALLCGRPAMRMAFCWHKSADRVGHPQGRRELNNNSNSSSRGGAPRPS
eukprot:CAMPEP_0194534078 /NCGR_PEP_ID=MMETSP0253-20130528/72121_1 /TAXON_ID=2966 /ORGANISM="Noctiluca scintillans" /LENGTH=191 /DNA_ID=CAMNT_0039379693 /DNA_START=373 /DNA_END=945 /DNA_ORIENTATION=-